MSCHLIFSCNNELFTLAVPPKTMYKVMPEKMKGLMLKTPFILSRSHCLIKKISPLKQESFSLNRGCQFAINPPKEQQSEQISLTP
jgi:hypothetical protein